MEDSGRLEFFESFVEKLKAEFNPDALKKRKMNNFLQPAELSSHLDLSIPKQGCTNEDILNCIDTTLKYSVKTYHSHFYNQLFGRQHELASLGGLVTECCNTSQQFYDQSPVFTYIEKQVLNHMLNLIGWSQGAAIFCPGGSMSNFYALYIARLKCYPESRRRGISVLSKAIVYTSKLGHYSVEKAVSFLGLGRQCVRFIDHDEQGQMIPEALHKQIVEDKQQGLTPFFVSATAGTTVYGAFDPLDKIAEVVEELGVQWLHVDGCLGGSCLVSPTLRGKLMKGVERAQSLSWNPHKIMAVPLQCSAIFVKEAHCLNTLEEDVDQLVSLGPDDTGKRHFMNSRKVDAFKLWITWQGLGDEGYAKLIEHKFKLAQYLGDKILSKKEVFRLIVQPVSTNVCFWFIPPSMRLGSIVEGSPEWNEKLSKVAPEIKKRLIEQGRLLIGYQTQGNLVNFFRMVTSQLDNTTSDMDFVLEEIESLGHDL